MSTVNANFTTWNDDQRRTSSYVVLGTAVVVALAALAVWYFVAATPAWLYWALVGLMVLVLVFMLVLLFVPARAQSEAIADPAPMAEHQTTPEPVATEAAAAPAQAFEPRVLTLRCGDCGTIFDVTDTGERPLYHTCPGCGAEGALRDEPVLAAPEAAPESAYAPPAAPETAPEQAPEVDVAAPIAPPVKRMKLRCGGCKEVFQIEDTGERPLKRACPHCGRIGQIQ